MKFLLAFLFIGLASASFYNVLDHAADQAVMDFMLGMEKAGPLRDVAGYDLGLASDEIEDDIKTELGKTLKEALDNVLNKIKDSIDQGKEVAQNLLDKAKDIAGQLKDLGVDAGGKALELLLKLKDRLKDWVTGLLEKLGIGKRSLLDILGNLVGGLDIRSIIEKIKNMIMEKLNIQQIVDYIKEKLGTVSELAQTLIQTIKERGLEALKDLVNKILGVGRSAYSLKDLWEKVKDFFKNLGIGITEKFWKFAEWVKTIWDAGIENAKDKLAKVKLIALEFITHAKDISAEVAREALEFFRPYKDDLGDLWNKLVEEAKKIIGTGV
ncbi:uncharacterized protein LOC106476266 [Limulus polyphemus]|uniref:Uncharacterized protein LOC106476266 n=1 Tax=Limulus polyphemus TaxID=6850 RepID=A0ABM1C128_LIMPO|nr:uncharacterized protein LOC106476266 [Limulus polyphemus]